MSKAIDERRLGRVAIAPHVLAGILTGKFRVAAHRLPFDAEVVRCHYDAELDNVSLTVASETLTSVELGVKIPAFRSPSLSSWTQDNVESPVPAVTDQDGSIVWVCGQFRSEHNDGNVWDLQGIFTDKLDAVKACKDRNSFVAPITIDTPAPSDQFEWPHCHYPLILQAEIERRAAKQHKAASEPEPHCVGGLSPEQQRCKPTDMRTLGDSAPTAGYQGTAGAYIEPGQHVGLDENGLLVPFVQRQEPDGLREAVHNENAD